MWHQHTRGHLDRVTLATTAHQAPDLCTGYEKRTRMAAAHNKGGHEVGHDTLCADWDATRALCAFADPPRHSPAQAVQLDVRVSSPGFGREPVLIATLRPCNEDERMIECREVETRVKRCVRAEKL